MQINYTATQDVLQWQDGLLIYIFYIQKNVIGSVGLSGLPQKCLVFTIQKSSRKLPQLCIIKDPPPSVILSYSPKVQSQTKDNKFGICCFSVKNAESRSKDWLARTHYLDSEPTNVVYLAEKQQLPILLSLVCPNTS